MGTVIVEYMLDCMRERDYNRDLDYYKCAWIDGLDTSYRDAGGNIKYISLDAVSYTHLMCIRDSNTSITYNYICVYNTSITYNLSLIHIFCFTYFSCYS